MVIVGTKVKQKVKINNPLRSLIERVKQILKNNSSIGIIGLLFFLSVKPMKKLSSHSLFFAMTVISSVIASEWMRIEESREDDCSA